jgi:hypothetical protein
MGINENKRRLLAEFVEFTCEECHQFKEPEIETLHAHRLRRGSNGGTYEHRNIKMVCNKCHKAIHSLEPGMRHK